MTPAGRSSGLPGTIHGVRGLAGLGPVLEGGEVAAEGLVWFLAPLLFQAVALTCCGAAGKCKEGLTFRRGDKQELLLGVGRAALGEWRRRMGEMSCEPVLQVSSLPTYQRFVALIARKKTWGQGFSLAFLLKCCHIWGWCLRCCSKGQVR